jgi:hypothetical protein
MKRIIFILILGLTPWIGFSQDTTIKPDTNSEDTVQQDIVNDHGEAGGIDANEIANNNKDAMSGLWIGLIAGTIGAVLMLGITSYLNSKKKKTQEEQRPSDLKLFIDESVEIKPNKEISAADVKKLKAEIKELKLKLEEAKSETTAYKKNLDIYTDFDQKYYNEAFRKLISPMNDAMEKGSRKEIIETLLKIMSHFSSLTRYKIAKKQAYDEPNMQYLMNQRMKNDAAIEIDSNTPIDKIPKNIKVLVDLLSEQSSTGLDESIISGYKIKNL